MDSGTTWEAYLRNWALGEGVHAGGDILEVLTRRFRTRLCAHGPYLFADLDGVTAADEQAAIDARNIQATGIRYVGQATIDRSTS